MARSEADREDMFEEAVALVRRVEFQPVRDKPSVLVGFRMDGVLAIYFGPDCMFQFDCEGSLRRSYLNGFLYRTQGTTLSQLRRHRSNDETTLLRQDLREEELSEFRNLVQDRIQSLLEHLSNGLMIVQRKHPADDHDLLSDLEQCLVRVMASSRFLAPAISGKR